MTPSSVAAKPSKSEPLTSPRAHGSESARPWRERQWRTHGNWEPLMFLYRRGDGAIRDLEALWREIHSEQAIERMHRLGANTCHLYFHKGYGLEHERESIAQASAWAQRLRDQGMRIGAYIGCTLFYETFGQEATERLAMQHGASGWSGSQYFRRFWCWNNPEAMAYFKGVVDSAISDFGADILHFDSGFGMPHSQLCSCEHCVRGFHQYVQREIPDIIRFAGYQRAEQLLPPPPGRGEHLAAITELREPGEIAWTLFHAWAGHQALRTLVDHARARRADIAILYNGANLCGITPYSRPNLEMGNLSVVDITAVEDDRENPIGVSKDGMPIARFRNYKASSRRGVRVYCYTTGPSYDSRVPLAEAAVFNHASLGMIELAMQSNRRVRNNRELQFLQYLTRHEDLFLDRVHRHDVAVLRHDRSALLNPFPSALSPYVVEQMLFEKHIPFGIIGQLDLNDPQALGAYRGIIVPDARCLDDDEAARLAAFVEQGGFLLSIGCTGRVTPLNQHRADWALGNLFPPTDDGRDIDWLYEEVPGLPRHGGDEGQPQRHANVLQARHGRGQAMHLERLHFTAPPPDRQDRFAGFPWYSHPWWQAPANADQFHQLLSTLLGDALSVRVDLPRHVGLETYRTTRGAAAYRLHVVNYDPTRPVPAFDVDLLPEPGVSIARCRWQSPQGDRVLEFSRVGSRLLVHCPSVEVLGTLVCEWE